MRRKNSPGVIALVKKHYGKKKSYEISFLILKEFNVEVSASAVRGIAYKHGIRKHKIKHGPTKS